MDVANGTSNGNGNGNGNGANGTNGHRRRRWLSLWTVFYLLFAAGLAFLVVHILLPAFSSPYSRVYASPMGYPSVMRLLHKPIDVEVTPVTTRRMARTFSADGQLAYFNQTPVRTEMLGVVTKLNVEAGQQVKAGDVLLHLNTGGHPTRLAELTEELRDWELKQQKANLERTQKLMAKGAATPYDLEQALLNFRHAEVNLRLAKETTLNSVLSRSKAIVSGILPDGSTEIKILATESGTVYARKVQLGENITSSDQPLVLMGDKLVFMATFDQRYASSIQLKDKGTFYLRAYPGVRMEGEVIRITPQVAPENQSTNSKASADAAPPFTFAVWMSLPKDAEAGRKLIMGMNGYCIFERPFSGPAIPETGLMRYSGRQGTVFVVDDNNRLQIKSVTYTMADDGWVSIESGLAEGERVVLRGQVALKPGDLVNVRQP
jgi:RND family efflux transporter MFP subunit